MIESFIKEELSISYISAMCAKAGISFDLQRHDDDSTDAIIKKQILLDGGRKFQSMVRVQLKATSSESRYKEHDKNIDYYLKVKNYNDLRVASTTPIILALLVLPSNSDEWLLWTEEELVLKGRMYWRSFKLDDETKNTDSIMVTIDKNCCVNPDSLLELLKTEAMEVLG